MSENREVGKRAAAGSVIFLSLIVAMEIVIMISPFAMFFYAVFNPFLTALNSSSLTRWLAAFFLPHMVVPPDLPLQILRIAGSVLFVAGLAIFLICAIQVYGGKIFKRGPAKWGFYAIIRHPQYVALAMAALGMSIMWPRFLTLALFAVMLYLYYLLAILEEDRMLSRFGDSYQEYLNRMGMFLPKRIERIFLGKGHSRKPLTFVKGVVVLATLLIVVVGSGFALRSYTIHHLPLTSIAGVDVLTITKDDNENAQDLIPALLADSTISARLQPIMKAEGQRVLAYFIPVDYVMQGMIANTGNEFKLFESHKTIAMITEYILHPYSHLISGHAHHMAMMTGQVHDSNMYNSPAMKRRVIFVMISSPGQILGDPTDDFGINVERNPLLFADIHLHTAELLQVQDTPAGSGWGTVPTPMF
jgi:protein-S-isoprenylcysteine O-methyltransferase Ste14